LNIPSEMSVTPAWNMALLVWPLLLAQELILGSATLSLMLGISTRSDADADNRGLGYILGRWWRVLAVVSFVFSLFVLINMVADMAGVSWAEAFPLIGQTLQQTHAGRVWEWQLPVTLTLLLVAWIPTRHFVKELLLLLLCTALLLMGSLTSHAIDHGATSVALHFIHELAAGMWAGALFAFWLAGRDCGAENRTTVAAAATLSRLAAWSTILLVVSGMFVAYDGLGLSLDHLLYSSYGQVLMVKLAVFCLALGVGAYNRYLIMPVLDRLSARQALVHKVCAEWLMIVVVLALAALLANTPPARMPTGMPMPMSGSRSPLTKVISLPG
jgi:putative copper resistance protein D